MDTFIWKRKTGYFTRAILSNSKIMMEHQRGDVCESCGVEPIKDSAHIFFNRDKKFAEWVDDERNRALVCDDCHTHVVDSPEFREFFMMVQIKRYGYEDMLKWLMSFPRNKQDGTEWGETLELLSEISEEMGTAQEPETISGSNGREGS